MTFEQKLATLIGAAIAIATLVECLIALAHRNRRSDRGATTYWHRGQQITRHDYAAIKAADQPDFAAWEREVRR